MSLAPTAAGEIANLPCARLASPEQPWSEEPGSQPEGWRGGGPDRNLLAAVFRTGYRVPPNYDSLVAKLLVHQPTRAEALAVMRRALAEFVIQGIHTTIPLHREIMSHKGFIDGQVDTTFIERNWQKG